MCVLYICEIEMSPRIYNNSTFSDIYDIYKFNFRVVFIIN